METIVVPVDGASNVKLEVLGFTTLETLYSRVTVTPVREVAGLKYNASGEEFAWFDSAIREIPRELAKVKVIAPVARGASGGLVGADNSLIEEPGRGLTLSYSQAYPEEVEKAFRGLVPDERGFYHETGSIRNFPGSLTLIKRFIFEELERPELLRRALRFGAYGALMAGHFLGDDYLKAIESAGNEHSYWMCHTGARNILGKPGTPSSFCQKIPSFARLVSARPACAYRRLGRMPAAQAAELGLTGDLLVVPGGHDSCFSRIPVLSTFYQAFAEKAGAPVIHLEAGSWTLVSLIEGQAELPADGYRRDILVQGTVDGEPVAVARYGGGNDIRYLMELAAKSRLKPGVAPDESALRKVLEESNCYVLPNINPLNHGTGPFPGIEGRIINETEFFQSFTAAAVLANLCVAITTGFQIEAIAGEKRLPVVLTGGGSKDTCFARLISTLTGREVYALSDRTGRRMSETTTLGAAIVGKAASLEVHPSRADLSRLAVTYMKMEPYAEEIKRNLNDYRKRFIGELKRADKSIIL